MILALEIALVSAMLMESAVAQTPTPRPQHQLVFTENPAGSRLTVTFDGSTSGISITGTPDHWSVTLPFSILVGREWFEPENSSFVNQIQAIATDTYLVRSDVNTGLFGTPVPNGTSTSFGTDPRDNVAIKATFNDNGDPVPDTGSALGLLFLALTALVGVNRFRYLQLA